MARKASANKKQKETSAQTSKKKTGFFEYLRFGESYTSLVLGIIVVIIATALLLSFVHNKDAGNVNEPISQQTQNTVQISQQANNLAKQAPNNTVDIAATPVPTDKPAPTIVPTTVPTAQPKPTAKPTTAPKIAIKPTTKPTAQPKPTEVVKKIVKAKPSPTSTPQLLTGKDNNVWIVQKNESLWIIAEKKYTSGYNWVDIAKANKLADPSNIHVGDRLILPKVAPKESTFATPTPKPTVSTNDEQFSSTKRATNEITSTSYTVVRGDTLWNIAVRAYGDGYRWPDIAKVNHLVNPGMIFSGNKLIIPRG